jgi:hypothetical protein
MKIVAEAGWSVTGSGSTLLAWTERRAVAVAATLRDLDVDEARVILARAWAVASWQ